MIVQLRVDDRLIHGQVALVWTRELNASGIVVANNEAAANEVTQMTLKMAVPTGKKLLIRSVEDTIEVLNNPKGKEMRMFVLTNCVKDAYEIAKNVQDIEAVNVANAGRFDKTDKSQIVRLSSAIALNPEEIEALKKLNELKDVKVFSQGLPTSAVQTIDQLLNNI
ncbi:PTS system mannose/fructose/N-acetylgalactosamine-transporter subunit IIB [Isobaculum melis]|uniref:PTS system, mannose-specific IIB component n=1 Tax=Isobaculum melis TaxID=142588 RepID=A0A1H9TLW8_9LACT|nr:PTS sugar transporter subunit IIB [Isobaculum melis]SER98126.1 PTS system, mannose-specific IIB component [Isobaculum melis]